MAAARVLDVGNCNPDRRLIGAMIEAHFDASIDYVMFVEEAQAALSDAVHNGRPHDLVLVNRRIFADDSDGGELIRRMKATPELAGVPVMMVSNYADAQDRAVADGAAPGFGKASADDPRTIERLARYLPRRKER